MAMSKQNLINIMSIRRINSTNKLILPQPKDEFAKRRQHLEEYNRELVSKQTFRSSKRLTSTAPYPYSSHGNRFLRSSLQASRFSPFELNNLKQQIRPFTQSGKKKYVDKSTSPLSIVKTKQQILTKNNKIKNFRSLKLVKFNFLKKGSSIDKAILSNVLKSKANMNICPSVYSYADSPANQQIVKLIKKQIPKGIKDVVGPQQMLRMSHIMTGVRFRTVNLNLRINSLIHEHKIVNENKKNQQQDNMTLKSIKRW